MNLAGMIEANLLDRNCRRILYAVYSFDSIISSLAYCEALYSFPLRVISKFRGVTS